MLKLVAASRRLTNARKRLWMPLRKKQGKSITNYAEAKRVKRFEEWDKMTRKQRGEEGDGLSEERSPTMDDDDDDDGSGSMARSASRMQGGHDSRDFAMMRTLSGPPDMSEAEAGRGGGGGGGGEAAAAGSEMAALAQAAAAAAKNAPPHAFLRPLGVDPHFGSSAPTVLASPDPLVNRIWANARDPSSLAEAVASETSSNARSNMVGGGAMPGGHGAGGQGGSQLIHRDIVARLRADIDHQRRAIEQQREALRQREETLVRALSVAGQALQDDGELRAQSSQPLHKPPELSAASLRHDAMGGWGAPGPAGGGGPGMMPIVPQPPPVPGVLPRHPSAHAHLGQMGHMGRMPASTFSDSAGHMAQSSPMTHAHLAYAMHPGAAGMNDGFPIYMHRQHPGASSAMGASSSAPMPGMMGPTSHGYYMGRSGHEMQMPAHGVYVSSAMGSAPPMVSSHPFQASATTASTAPTDHSRRGRADTDTSSLSAVPAQAGPDHHHLEGSASMGESAPHDSRKRRRNDADAAESLAKMACMASPTAGQGSHLLDASSADADA